MNHKYEMMDKSFMCCPVDKSEHGSKEKRVPWA